MLVFFSWLQQPGIVYIKFWDFICLYHCLALVYIRKKIGLGRSCFFKTKPRRQMRNVFWPVRGASGATKYRRPPVCSYVCCCFDNMSFQGCWQICSEKGFVSPSFCVCLHRLWFVLSLQSCANTSKKVKTAAVKRKPFPPFMPAVVEALNMIKKNYFFLHFINSEKYKWSCLAAYKHVSFCSVKSD